MKSYLKNEIYKNGFAVARDVFNDDELKSLLKIITNKPYNKIIQEHQSGLGFYVKNKNFTTLKDLYIKQPESIVKKTQNIFEKTKFFKDNCSGFSNNDWNALRISFPKEKFKNVSWHQDIQTPLEKKMNILKLQFFTFWIPFSSVNENNSIEIVKMSDTSRVYSNHYKYDIDLPAKYKSNARIKIEASLGDIIILDSFTFHRSIYNSTNLIRISVDLRYTNKVKVKYSRSLKLIYRMLKNDAKTYLKNIIVK
ncbi:MAG: hypothetical protein CMP36_00150 [Rickettsiales bacterium]|nr:hypothetical protein [Rickettsiales bacterium]OUV83609.1 MAG: hypothetical protein CBC91_00385 [Rickettsiales bacterium TMED131]